jgi:hypothetical protein
MLEGKNLLRRRVFICLAAATVTAISGGCGHVKTTHTLTAAQKVVVKDATREELVEKYNAVAQGVRTVNATVQLKATTGSQYSGVIEDYHEVKAFLLAARPAYIRVIGQAPVIGKTIFDMASDSETFRVSIPSKNKFLVGPVAVERSSTKPIENLRPQHLLDAMLWSEIRKPETVLFEEFNDENARYYILTVLRGGYQTEILRKVWFNRADLQVSRLEEFGPKGVLLSDIRYSDWESVGAEQDQSGQPAATQSPASQTPGNAPPNGPPLSSNVASFPRTIRIDRPHDDYSLDLQITKVSLNEPLPPDRFQLEQPPGSELVRVGEDSGDKPK